MKLPPSECSACKTFEIHCQVAAPARMHFTLFRFSYNLFWFHFPNVKKKQTQILFRMRSVSRKLERTAYVKNELSVWEISTYDQTQGAFKSYENETMTFDFVFFFFSVPFLSFRQWFRSWANLQVFENGNSQLMNKWLVFSLDGKSDLKVEFVINGWDWENLHTYIYRTVLTPFQVFALLDDHFHVSRSMVLRWIFLVSLLVLPVHARASFSNTYFSRTANFRSFDLGFDEFTVYSA